mgnify:CR=1 FL=1
MSTNRQEIIKLIEDYLSNPINSPENIENRSFNELIQEFSNIYTELDYQNQELRITQEALENSHKRLLEVFHNAPVGFALVDNDFRLGIVNAKLKELLRNHKACKEGSDLRLMIHPQDQTRFHFFFKQLNELENRSEEPFRLIGSDDQVLWFKITGKKFSTETGLRQNLLVFEDFTEAVAAKTALEENRRMLDVITQNTHDIIALTGADTRFKWVSPSIRLLGYEPHELIEKSVFNLVAEPFLEIVSEAVNKAMITKTSGKLEYQCRKKDGSYEWVETIGNFIFGKEGEISELVFVTRIITDRKTNEEALKRSAELLEASNTTKDMLFSIIAHDLRSPFMSLLGLSEIIADRSYELNIDQLREMGQSMNDTAKMSFDLLEDLLDWSRVQRGIITPKKEPIDVEIMLNGLKELTSDSLKKKRLSLEINCSGELKFYSDRHILQSILRNLISNAIKFSERDSSIGIEVTANQNNVLFVVADHGIGIPIEMMPKLFVIDDTKRRKGTDGERSTGLGLVVANDLINLLNGKLWAQPNGEKGTRFYCEIPAFFDQ